MTDPHSDAASPDMRAGKICKINRALISVSDKSGLAELGRGLAEFGVEVLSTGGTFSQLQESGVEVREVSAHTGFPEMMEGRVKTLHPIIHGGILGRRGVDDKVMRESGIAPIDLVVVNLYPFEQTVASPSCPFEEAVENIDIGGPTLLRAAAKNHADVAVVTDPEDYGLLIEELKAHGGVTAATRLNLAKKAFSHTARYDGVIANYLGLLDGEGGKKDFPETLTRQYRCLETLRYGENPHQGAALYGDTSPASGTLTEARFVQGKALSYNNLADTDAALECVRSFSEPACVIVKHANPCGVAVAENIDSAYESAYRTDPTSAFGGIIAFNRPLGRALAATLTERQFIEVIVAPTVDEGARPILATKPNIRVLEVSENEGSQMELQVKRIDGGLLVQDPDRGTVTSEELQVVSESTPDAEQMADLIFAWKVAKYVKSNAIVYARDLATVGIGAGQMSRVYSAKIAGIKARDEGLAVEGAVMASDAFFPFRDGIDAAHEVGIRAVIQPGGSMRDDEVIAAANEHGIVMVFTGMRHFRH